MTDAPTPKNPPVCTVLRLRRATRKATRVYDRHLAQLGIGIAQFGILQTISGASDRPLGEIASALEMDRTTLTRNLRPLLSRGLVRFADAPDRRTRRVALTEEGEATLLEARRAWRIAQDETRKRLGPAQTDELHRLLALLLSELPPD